MSDDAPAIPFVLPPQPSLLRRQENRRASPGPPDAFAVAWRKPVFSVFQSTEKGAVLVGGRFGGNWGGIGVNMVGKLQLSHR